MTPARFCVFIVILSVVAPAIIVAWRGAGLSRVGSVLVTLLVAVALALHIIRTLPAAPGHERRLRFFFVLWVVLGLFGGYRIARMSVFMLDSEQIAYAINPTARPIDDPELQKPFFRHNCFTSYVIGAHLATQGIENIYDSSRYRDPVIETPIHLTIGDRHTIDTYQYPPPFLILPRLMQALDFDFFRLRAYWFAFSVLAICATVWVLARWIGGPGFNAYWFAWPLLFAAPVTHSTLQIGNVHFLIICLSVVAMLAFEKRRDWLGGACLGFAIVSKVFPGVLLAYLLIRRRWSAAWWTVGAMVVFCLFTVALFGVQPFNAFVNFQLPRLASGEAFAFMTTYSRPIVVNLSTMGIAYKLDKLGLLADVDPARVAAIVTWLYSAVLVLIIIYVGLKHGRPASAGAAIDTPPKRRAFARTWLALLVLAQLRNPFLPWDYGNLATIWLLATCVPVQYLSIRRVITLAAAWLLFAILLPLRFGPPTIALDLWYTLAATIVSLGLGVGVVLRQGRLHSATEPAIPVQPAESRPS